MIKFVVVLTILSGICDGYTVPLQNAFMYYQQPMGALASRQSLYGIHYQNQQLRNPGRSAAVSAFAAGNTIATGTYLKDCQDADDASADLPAPDQNVQSVADAYPEEQVPLEDGPQNEVPAVHESEAEDPIAEETPAASPSLSAVIPDKKKKKVTVQLESDEEEQDSQSNRRGASRPASSNAFFPINFGGTNGDIIAIANSYSTGKDGSAISSASAYGSGAAPELRKTNPVQLKRKPAKVRARQN